MIPTVTVSYAQSLDGRIATVTGDSQWISGPETLKFAHTLRKENDAVLVGIGTVLADDPELSCRLPGNPPSPVRIVLDSALRLSPASKICRTADKFQTMVFASHDAERSRQHELELRGIQVVRVGTASGYDGLSLNEVLRELGERGLKTLFVEGGAKVITSFFRFRLADRLIAVCAPVLIGNGTSAVGDMGVRGLSDAVRGKTMSVTRAGEDIIWEVDLRQAAEEAEKQGAPADTAAAGTAAAVYFTGPKQVEIRQEKCTPAAPGDVRVISRCIGISHGTELHFYRDSFVRGPSQDGLGSLETGLEYPVKYGYMNAGVADFGDGSDSRVFAFYPHQDIFYADPAMLIRFPDPEVRPVHSAEVPQAGGPLSFEDIVLYPSLETAYTIALDAAPLPGEEVMIIGLGIIGILTAEILSMNRSIRVTASEQRPERVGRGEDLGIRCLLPDAAGEIGGGEINSSMDTVIDTTGKGPAVRTALRCLRKEGTLIEAAWTGAEQTSIELGKDFHRKRLIIKASQVSSIPGPLLAGWDRGRRTGKVVELLYRIRPSKYVTHRIPLIEAAEAYELIDRQEEDALQVVLIP